MRELKGKLEEPVAFDAVAFKPEIAIGSVPNEGSSSRAELFEAATCAVIDAAGRPDRVMVAHDLSALDETDRFVDLLQDLRAAIKNDALELHYMPKLRLRDDRVVCAEALCRWTHPTKGIVSPAEFIHLAEDSGLIGDLTMWTLDRAINDQRELLARDGFELGIDINLSAQLIGHEAFCDELLARIGRASGRIGLEITETAEILDSGAALDNFKRIRQAGLHVAIDDFGTGLSSLSYLRDLPADELKIDQVFVRALTTNNRDPLLVKSAIDIAHALEMEITAEGVEDEIAQALLTVMGCDNLQGYYISPPLSLPALRDYLCQRAQTEAENHGAEAIRKMPPRPNLRLFGGS